LAKSAYDHDLSLSAEAGNDWEFAIAVLKLQGHQMLWLLQWGGVEEKKPWWDKWLLLAAAFLVIVVGVGGMCFAGIGPPGQVRWIIVFCGFVGLLLLIPFLSQRLERRRLQRMVEACRSSLSGKLR
jgi:membrane associated rhomboid family serine protease